MRAKARAVEQSYSKLEATLHRTPTDAEVAADLEMTDAEFQTALRKISFVGVVALDEVFRGGDRSDRSTLGETLPDSTAGPMDTFEVKETKEALIQAVGQMAEREKTVLTLYYYEGLTLAEIGDILGVTESRVCQIHTKAVLQLRAKLADRPEAAGRRAPTPEAKSSAGTATEHLRPPQRGPRHRVVPRRGQVAQAGPHLGHRLRSTSRPGPSEWSARGRRTTMEGPRQPARRTSGIEARTRPRPRSPLTRGAAVGMNQPSEGAVTWPSSP